MTGGTSSLAPLVYVALAPFTHLLATIFLLVSMTTTSWMYSDSAEEYFGLFQMCVSDDCREINRNSRITENFRPIVSSETLASVCVTEDCHSWVSVVESVRFLMAAAFSCALFALIMSFLFAYKSMTTRSASLGYVIITCFCSAVTIIMSSVACDVYTREVYQKTLDANTLEHKIGYSLVLAGLGGALAVLGGIISMVTSLKVRNQLSPSDHFLHAPPSDGCYGNPYGRLRDGHVSWVERKAPPSLSGEEEKQGAPPVLPPLRGKGDNSN